jgi:CheY-like chemotaxis protein
MTACAEALLSDQLPVVLATPQRGRELPAALATRVAHVGKPIRRAPLLEALGEALGVPSDRRHPVPATGPTPPLRPAAPNPLRIIVAEDNPINQRVALKVLEHLGYRADIVGSGLELIDALRRCPCDVVLLDVQMPGMDGFEAARCIRAEWPASARPRLIGLTAMAMEGDRERCLEAGMDDYVTKPIQPDLLRRALERCEPLAPAPSPPAANGMTLDLQVLADLRLLQDPGAPDFVTELIGHFLREVPQSVADLTASLAAGDARRASRVAHSMKSSCANLGAMRLSRLCAAIERLASAGEIGIARGTVSDLEAECLRVEPLLRAECRQEQERRTA